ncbi:hypothetical protein [Aneurinibacillus aneurinilyticus]|uniref:hypothetical protein n=1 Tax=Aneurinibacillus aneurinilyticus TaxID=1391 RepID=UPI003526ABA0
MKINWLGKQWTIPMMNADGGTGSGSGGGTGGSDGGANKDTTGGNDGGSQNDKSQEGNQDGEEEESQTFTSEQIEDAKKEAARAAKTDLYKQLGVNSMKDLQERLQDAGTKEQADEQLRNQVQQQNVRINELETELAFVHTAVQYKPYDTGLLFAAIKPLLQTDPDTGEVTNMVAAIEQVKKEKSFLFAVEGGEGQQQSSQNPPKPNNTSPGAGDPPASKKGADLGKSLADRFNKKLKG